MIRITTVVTGLLGAYAFGFHFGLHSQPLPPAPVYSTIMRLDPAECVGNVCTSMVDTSQTLCSSGPLWRARADGICYADDARKER